MSSSAPLHPRAWINAVCAALVLSSTFLAAAPASASASTYYVDCSAKSAGDGSQSAPWNSVQAVNRHAKFGPGDSVLLKRGTTCTGRLVPKGSGSEGAPIVLGAYKGKTSARPTIAGGGTGNRTGAVQLRNQQWWTIQDLHLTNRGAARETNAYRSGLLVLNEDGGRLAGITAQRLKVDSVTSNLTTKSGEPRDFGGISVITAPFFKNGSGFDGLRIQHNDVSKVGRTGIVVSNYYPKTSPDRRLRIAYNRVVRARGDSIMIRGSVGARIDHNVSAYGADFWPCKQCGGISPETANAAIWPLASRGTVIEYNEVYGMRKLGGDGAGIDVDMSTDQTVVQYNYVHDNEGGGILFCGSNRATARFNILENNARSAFVFIGSIPATSTKIYNNTVYSAVGNNARVVHTQGDKGGRGITFFNNLIYNMDDSGYYVWPTKPTTRTNTYIGVHGIAEPAERGKGWSDPGLRRPGSGGIGFGTLNGYRPATPSDDPAGSPVPRSITKDFFGKKINPAKPPRGAAG